MKQQSVFRDWLGLEQLKQQSLFRDWFGLEQLRLKPGQKKVKARLGTSLSKGRISGSWSALEG